jgi:hypothetical protein
MGFSLFFMTAGRDVLIAVWANKLFDGEIQGDLFQSAQMADKALDHTLSVLLFVGLSFIKLGIGFAIATIVRHLRATGQGIIETYSSVGVQGAEASRFTEPWYGRSFTRFLLSGMLIVLISFGLALWWAVNLVFLKQAEFDGETTGAAYHTYLMIERILDPLVFGGKFLGEALLILGIVTGLATIIVHLSFQARALPRFTRRVLARDGAANPDEPVSPSLPSALVKLGLLGAATIALAVPGAFIRAGFIGVALEQQFDGSINLAALRAEGILARTMDPLVVMGLRSCSLPSVSCC